MFHVHIIFPKHVLIYTALNFSKTNWKVHDLNKHHLCLLTGKVAYCSWLATGFILEDLRHCVYF